MCVIKISNKYDLHTPKNMSKPKTQKEIKEIYDILKSQLTSTATKVVKRSVKDFRLMKFHCVMSKFYMDDGSIIEIASDKLSREFAKVMLSSQPFDNHIKLGLDVEYILLPRPNPLHLTLKEIPYQEITRQIELTINEQTIISFLLDHDEKKVRLNEYKDAPQYFWNFISDIMWVNQEMFEIYNIMKKTKPNRTTARTEMEKMADTEYGYGVMMEDSDGQLCFDDRDQYEEGCTTDEEIELKCRCGCCETPEISPPNK